MIYRSSQLVMPMLQGVVYNLAWCGWQMSGMLANIHCLTPTWMNAANSVAVSCTTTAASISAAARHNTKETHR